MLHIPHLKRGFIVALALSTAVCLSAGTAQAKTYRWVTWKAKGAGDAMALTTKWFADEFAKRTGGKEKIEVMWGGSAASIRETPDAISAGVGAMGDIALPYFMDKFVLNNAAGYFVPQPLSAIELAESMERWHEIYPQFDNEFAKYKLKAIAWRPLEAYGLLCTKPVRNLADLKGKRIRSYGTAYPALIEALGATPVSVTTTEAYQALERGILDCTPTGLSYAHGFKYDEVAKYYTALPLGSSYGQVIAMNLDAYNSLDEVTREILVGLGREYSIKYVVELNKVAEQVRAGWKKKGVEYISFPKDGLREIVENKGVQAIRQKWIGRATELGVPAEKIADELRF